MSPQKYFNFIISFSSRVCPALPEAQTVIPPGLGQMTVTRALHATLLFLPGSCSAQADRTQRSRFGRGDEDRGTGQPPLDLGQRDYGLLQPGSSGTFSTTITIPNLEKVYYFRAVASNVRYSGKQ